MSQIKIYNQIAKKFGQYSSGSKKTFRFINGDPEKVFLELLLKNINKNSRLLDLGCADGRFTLKIAPLVEEIIGIDLSKEMLKLARKNKTK